MVTQPSTNRHIVCLVYVCVCACVLLCQVFDIAAHLGNYSYYFSPVITAYITSHSNILQFHKNHFTSLCAGGLRLDSWYGEAHQAFDPFEVGKLVAGSVWDFLSGIERR